MILAAIYLLWLIQRVFFGPITNEENRNVPEIAWNEIAALVPLVVLMVWIGVHPNTFLRKMTPSVQQLLQIVHKTDASKAMIAERRTGTSTLRPLVPRLSRTEVSVEPHSAARTRLDATPSSPS